MLLKYFYLLFEKKNGSVYRSTLSLIISFCIFFHQVKQVIKLQFFCLHLNPAAIFFQWLFFLKLKIASGYVTCVRGT
jgi:hypothetical protein